MICLFSLMPKFAQCSKGPNQKMPLQQCNGLTKKGERCSRTKRTDGQYYCKTHQNQSAVASDGYESDSTMRSGVEQETEPKVFPTSPTHADFLNERIIVKDFFDMTLKDTPDDKEYLKFLIDDIQSKLATLKVALEQK